MSTSGISNLLNLNGKVAIVTGAAMGIGQGIALRLAEAGASVLISDINADAASHTKEQITRSGGKAAVIQADASISGDADRVVQTAVAKFGQLDILVNNAGIYIPSAFMDLSEELLIKTMDINLKGLFFYSKAAAKKMIEGGQGGRIINIASCGAIVPSGNLIHYDATKGGVISLTKSLAKELGQHNILINAIAPGGVPTPGGAAVLASLNLPPDAIPPARSVLGRWGTPDDIAKVVCFLSSSMSDYMTGSIVVVDGGYLLM
ncbi:MAG: SDR family oxidoreductase [Proteobacteria bacterium]|nr:SDR family oxidoreductase [Pseudomonadota bacterium]